MFYALKLIPYKALPQVTLPDLGRVNIVCGKNSSGKSTLLTAISNTQTRYIGQSIIQDQTQFLVKNSISATGWDKQIQTELNDRYRATVVNVAETKSTWYGDESLIFAQQVDTAFRTDRLLRQWQFSSGNLANAFLKLFKDDISSVVVSPKRYIESRSTIRMDATVLANGYGLLPYLFFAKNQPATSPDGRIYSELSEVFSDISSGAHFDIFPSKDASLDLFFAQSEQWTPAEDSGLGLQELLIILYFAINPNYKIVLLEEPESHLHPE